MGSSSIIHFRFGRIPMLLNQNNWEWKLVKKNVAICDHCIVLDRLSYDTLLNVGLKNVSIIPNPISQKIIVQINEHINNPIREKGVVLFVGHIIPEKGVYELVESCKQIPEVKEVRIVGPIEDEVKRTLELKGNGKITFLGVKEHYDIINEMKRCSIFVLPSYTEGFPNVVLEAMISSCPIIATSVGAIPEMLADGAGICVEPKKVMQLTESIELLINNATLANKFGMNAKQHAINKYSMDIVVEKLENIWLTKLN